MNVRSRWAAAICAVALLGSGLARSASAQAQPAIPNLTYGVIGGRPLRLDLYLPASGNGPFPVVLWIHGGGWNSGGRYPIPSGAAALLSRGIAVASITYRLTSQADLFGGAPVIFPAQINDVKGAVRWLRANADACSLDPARFGAWGSSAGGQLAALLGTSGGVEELEGDVGGNLEFSSAIQACADYYAPTDLLEVNPDVTTPPGSTLDHDAPDSPESQLLGWSGPGQGVGDIRANRDSSTTPYPALLDLASQASPITFVDSTDPAFIIAHGTNDTIVPRAQSVRLVNALTAAGVPNTYLIVQGADHFNLGAATDSAIGAFFAHVFGLPSAPPPGCFGDLDGDGVRGSSDLAMVLGSWGGGPGPADIDGDGVVGSGDLAALLGSWGPCP